MIRLTIGQDGLVPLTITPTEPLELTVSEGCGGPGYPHYKGPYQVTPSVASTVLETTDKVLDDDVTVHPIPFFRVSNPAGGTPVTSAGTKKSKFLKRRIKIWQTVKSSLAARYLLT